MSDTAEVIDLAARLRHRRMREHPEAMFSLPDDNKELLKQAKGVIEICRSDASARMAYYKQINMLVETGRVDGTRSLLNLLYRMLDRLAALLFSPAEIRFALDFENEYDKETLARGTSAARVVRRSWERSNSDILFSEGVFEALKYGCVIWKERVRQTGDDRIPICSANLVMPWNFGVYKPHIASLDEQPALVETIPLTLPEVWRRIHHLPNAVALFDRVKQTAEPGGDPSLNNSFFHQVLSTSQIQTGVGGSQRPIPGGMVQLSNDPNFSGIGPSSTAPTVTMQELWMWDGDDYTTIQIIEPDILIAPLYKKSNLLIQGQSSGLQPYGLIQPNHSVGNIWGRSEITDLIEPQQWISDTAADIKRLFGLQVDKLLAFTGDGLTDERYDQFRAAGWANLGMGGDVKDLTPSFPPESLPLVDKIIQLMDMIGGFDNLLSGRGESGVRSGVQSSPLMKTAGAPVKDRSLIVERQCAAAADLRLSIMEAKDGRAYWTDAKRPKETQFLLSDLPDDRRVVVDGHTTSPVFADENAQMTFLGIKAGMIDQESAIEMLPFQNKDILISRLKEKQEAQQKVMVDLKQQNPEEYAKLLEKQASRKR